ncbi:MAG: hypothetical protein BGO51_18160 [Rhodospirillales bacterium 69-11]|nr:hypothetical protein [Rhodospirillales bacterium]OJW19303.1 MAG: hypothetical protein BGO51_18160 [Rhodospirillales bacterium 69-11]
MFTPVQIAADTAVRGQRQISATVPRTSRTVTSVTSDRIKFEWPYHTHIRAGEDVGPPALRRV